MTNPPLPFGNERSLPSSVRAVMEEYADLHVSFATDNFVSVAADILSGAVDVVVSPLHVLPYPVPEGMEAVALLDDDLVAVSRARRPDIRARFHASDRRWNYGKVWLVGMGPGDPDLMTVKADHVLRNADVIFYDSLIDQSVLDRYPAARVNVGKRKGNHTQQQHEINKLLFDAALAGQTVVRLKGGDPFIFGRGGEEAEYLQRRMVPVEVVPGVSAAIGAAAATGVPLTKRGSSRILQFHTVHQGVADAGDEPTRVYFMGASRLPQLSRQLIDEGFAPETPVTVVQSATWLEERNVGTTVAALTTLDIASPIVVIVGAVAAERRTDGKCLFTGANPFRFRCPERVTHYPITSSGVRKHINVEAFSAVAFCDPAAVDTYSALYGFRNDVLYYCTSAETLARLRALAPTAVAVLCS